jgi:uncharacterized circularly permuted ATP-grasp superfamily protein
MIVNVQTYICDEEADRKYVIENIHNLVVKQTDANWLWNAYRSKSTKKQNKYCKNKHNPRNYMHNR